MRVPMLFTSLIMAMTLLPVTTSAKMMESMSAARIGMLHGSAGHHAAGSVHLDAEVLTLTLEKIDKVPDGRVYLTLDGDRRRGVELGALTQFSGEVRYPLPQGLDATKFDSVVIWCEKFSVEIGRAVLADEMTMKEKDRTMQKHAPRSATFAVH